MSGLTKTLQDFHSAVLLKDPQKVIHEIKPAGKIPAAQQLSIYIDGYRIRLKNVLRADYPALLYYLGEEEFGRLALEFIENNPSADFNLDRYPVGFASFLARESADRFARELAKLESIIAAIFMMEETGALEPTYFTGLSPEDFAKAKLLPRIAAKFLQFDYPVNEYLAEFREGKNPAKPEERKTFIYILRHRNNVQRHQVPEEAAALLEHLFSGNNMEESLSYAVEGNENYAGAIATNLQSWFANWTKEGFFRDY